MDKSLRSGRGDILNTHNKFFSPQFHHFNLPLCPLRLTFGMGVGGAPCDMVISPLPSRFSGKFFALRSLERMN